MPYIGKSPTGTGVRSRYYFTASGSETSLSGASDSGATLLFTDGAYVDVSLNGVALVAGTDYNTTTANTIGGLSALSASDIVEILVYDIFTVADTVPASSGGTFSGGVTMGGTLSLQSANFKMTDLTTNAFYRTGTWTPIVSGDNATDGDATIFSTTPATAYGTYTRIGDLVAVSWTYINGSGTGYTNNGSDASHLRIVGLPFNLKNVSTYNPGGVIHDYLATSGWAAGYTPMTSGIYNTKKIIVHYANGAVMELADAVYWNVADAKFAGSLVYETDEA